MWKVIFEVQKVLIFFTLLACVAGEELAPKEPTLPIHNLIPRFKMPRGNLLRYRIPQWEVLYYLKYGIVPFIFYDPNFNRTNFVTQLHKFKMYFDDGLPNRTEHVALKDDESFKEFLRTHGFPNYNFPEDALSRNNKMAEEIDGLLRAASTDDNTDNNDNSEERRAIFSSGNGNVDGKNSLVDITNVKVGQTDFPSLDVLWENLKLAATSTPGLEQETPLYPAYKKRSTGFDPGAERRRRFFWHTFVNKYPLNYYRLPKSIYQGTMNGFLVDHDPGWTAGLSPYSSRAPGSDLRRNTKSFSLGLRNDDSGGGGGEDPSRAGNEPRRGGKNFQTQGW